MADQKRHYELASKIEHYLATLAKLYEREGHRQKLELLVNSSVRVHEEWSYDNWNNGTYGHAIFLTVPEALYLSAVRKKDEIRKEIASDINKINNVQNEYIDEVFIEMEELADRDWRKESGLLTAQNRTVGEDATHRIWGTSGYRVFLSHKSEVKRETADLKSRLQLFGISCFVAHEDVHPTKEWQDEIENALSSMDAFVALMTSDFHDSLWTDQEVGFALGRGVPIVAVKLGKDLYGFIGKFQALSCAWDSVPRELAKLLVRQPRMLESFISAVERCTSFDNGNALAHVLPNIQQLSDKQVLRLINAFNTNGELRGRVGFTGSKSRIFGEGLAPFLSRTTGRKHQLTGVGVGMRISH